MARSTFRSVSYDLDAALALARHVASYVDGVSSEELAASLGYSGVRNGAFLARLANARLFGVVAGRSSRVVITDRGRRALSAGGTDAGSARAAAFLSVPLFRAVFDRYAGSPTPSLDELDSLLRTQLGEQPSKARVSAAKLLDSARQAGLVRGSADAEGHLTSRFAGFTDFTDDAGLPATGGVVSVEGYRGLGLAPTGSIRTDASFRDVGEVGDEMNPITEGSGGAPIDDPEGLWLAEEHDSRTQRATLRRRISVAMAVVVGLAVVAVPVSLALSASNTKAVRQASAKLPVVTRMQSSPMAVSQVLSALSATTDAGNFDFTYNLTGTPGTAPAPPTTTTTPVACPMVTYGGTVQSQGTSSTSVHSQSNATSGSAGVLSGGPMMGTAPTTTAGSGSTSPPPVPQSPCCPPGAGGPPVYAPGQSVPGSTGGASATIQPPVMTTPPNPPTTGQGGYSYACAYQPISGSSQETPVSGSGAIDLNPTAMVATAAVGSGGGLNVVVRASSTTLWEQGPTPTGSTPGTASLSGGPAGGGQPVSGFAGITESTLGNRNGAVAMMGLASPTGYLDLDQQQVNNADRIGTGSVGGIPVTIYQVQITPAQEAQVPGASAEEMTTITNALATLKGEGYTGTTVKLSIDGEGYIREADSTANFSDGGTTALSVTLSNFGCAGTVLMPGQQGSGVPPTGCTSPVPSTTTTTAPNDTTTTTTAPTTSTTGSTKTTVSTATTVPTTVTVTPNSSVPPSSTTTTIATG